MEHGLLGGGRPGLSPRTWSRVVLELAARKLAAEDYYDHVSVSASCPWEFILPLTRAGVPEADVAELWDLVSARTGTLAGSCAAGVRCPAGRWYACVSASGEVGPCASAAPSALPLRFGSIAERSLGEVWGSPPFRALRSLTLSDIDGPGCHTCRLRRICGGGCRLRALVGTGRLEGADPLCPLALPDEGGRMVK